MEWTRRDYNKNENTNLSIHNENSNCWGTRPLISPDPHSVLSSWTRYTESQTVSKLLDEYGSDSRNFSMNQISRL